MSPRVFMLRLLALVLLLGAGSAQADTAIKLWKAFDGRVNFTGTQVSLRTKSNSNGACTVASSSTNRTAKLTLPVGATVLSAQLYWAGSGTSDSTVTFEGKSVTAGRKYTSSTVGGGLNYFGGAADVTSVVKAKGSGTYTFSGLTVSIGNPWCASQAVLGGFSLLVVYAHPTEPERVLNLYEGFRYVQNSEVVVSASNFRWNRTDWPVRERTRVGHITWEGDPTLAQDGERLLFEGNEVSDSLNPEGNQFNSKSNINGDSASYGIDFDAYDASVVIWSYFDARVTTSYRTGQDLVLLNAEILVVPTMPVSDLAVSIARPGALQVGRNTVYNITVTNTGPYTEAGPITVTTTLPAGMGFVSSSGSNWTCTLSGQVVTCVYRGAVAPDTNAVTLAITASVQTVGDKKTTVSVKGTDDDNAANNTASNTGTAAPAAVTPNPTPGATSYIFTNGKCVAGLALGATGQTCRAYSASTIGGYPTDIWLTAVSGGVPTALSKSSATTVAMQFSLDCVNPDSGSVSASYGAPSAPVAVPACAAAGQPANWSTPRNVSFPVNEASVQQSFVYNDIGKVTLNLLTGGATASTAEFVVAPRRIDFRSIRYGTLANPRNTAPDSAGFAPAGAPLTLEVGALLYDLTTYAPNFGNENAGTRPGLKLTHAKIANVDLLSAGELTQDAPDWDKTESVATIGAAWSEVGAIAFTICLLDPDNPGAGDMANRYLGVATQGSTVPVGRFYPAYFRTIVTGPFDCPASLPTAYTCPGPRGATYSEQPFNITVEAYNFNNELVQNFNELWFRTITLSAVTAAGTDGRETATRLAATSGAATVTIGKPPKLLNPDRYPMTTMASFKLATGYNDLQPRAAVSNPRTIYVRAVASDTVVTTSGSTATVNISSLLPAGETSDEGGILVLNGRLKLANALGSDTLRTPLALRAEYFAGATDGWLFNQAYADPLGAGAAGTAIVSCTPDFADGKPCAEVIGAANPQTVTLNRGAGALWLRAPGKRQNGAARGGSVTLRYNGWTWLPSTTGRISFGSHRSPVIYVREMYY